MLYDVGNTSPYQAYADRLPSLPSVVIEVMRLCRQESVEIPYLAEVIGRDPALSFRVLKLSNSSLYGRRRQISTLHDAVMLLGVKAVMLAALSFSLTAAVPEQDELSGYDLREFWKRALIQSIAARTFARNLGRGQADEALICGLLMDVSIPIFAKVAGERYWPVIISMDAGHPEEVIERQHVGTTHASLAGQLMSDWKLPQSMVDSISLHHAPDALERSARPEVIDLCRILHLSHLSACVMMCERKGEFLHQLNENVARWFGRDTAFVDGVLRSLTPNVEQLAEVVRVDIGGDIAVGEILDLARAELMNMSLSTASDLNRAESRVAELEVKASTDALTGLHNRAAFDSLMRSEWEKRGGEEFPTPLGLMMIDVDHFKAFNDRYGHPAGDQVLRSIAAVLKGSVRAADTACRYGGEEFAIVCPGASGASLRGLAERLRKAIEGAVIVIDGAPVQVTASIGIGALTHDPAVSAFGVLVSAADEALYRAKHEGRNRVGVAEDL